MVTSKRKETKTGQVLKHTLTATEKRILVHMLNAGLTEGQVRNKIFSIEKKINNTAKILIETITKSIYTGKKEVTKNRLEIKYS